MSMNHGFPPEQWTAGKEEARAILWDRAKVRGKMPYSELVSRLQSVKLDAHDARLFQLLAELSTEESEAGRGMLSAIVVHKVGDMQPGPGFFDLAEQLGRDTTDRLKCWVDEFNHVYASAQR